MEYRRDVSGWHLRWDEAYARKVRAAGMWPDRTVADFAEERVRSHPHRIQLIDGSRHLTSKQLWQESLALAGFMTEIGITRGEVVSYQLPPWYESAVINLASAMIGTVLHPILPMYREAETAYMLRETRSKLIFVPQYLRNFDHLAMIHKIASHLETPIRIVVVRPEERQSTLSCDNYQDVLSTVPLKARPKVDPDAVKLILFTSGTTGRAKGVLHTHNTINADGLKMGPAMSLTSEDICFSPSPVAHVSGALWAHNMVWMWDMKCVLQDKWDAAVAFDLIREHRCTFVPAATPFLQGIVDEAQRRGTTLPSLRYWAIGGAAVPPQLVYTAARLFPNVIAFRNFGATEVPSMTVPPSTREGVYFAAETDGRLSQCEIKIVDALTGEPVPEGAEGEIHCREPSMALGYAKKEDNAEAYDADGLFKMGDLVRRVHGDHVVVTGRKKDLIIRSGENISAKEIEDALFAHPDITDIAVVAMMSKKTGEGICAFVVPRDNTMVTLSEIAAFLEVAGLARQKTPERIVLVTELPRTASGKVQKHLLRDQINSSIAESALH